MAGGRGGSRRPRVALATAPAPALAGAETGAVGEGPGCAEARVPGLAPCARCDDLARFVPGEGDGERAHPASPPPHPPPPPPPPELRIRSNASSAARVPRGSRGSRYSRKAEAPPLVGHQTRSPTLSLLLPRTNTTTSLYRATCVTDTKNQPRSELRQPHDGRRSAANCRGRPTADDAGEGRREPGAAGRTLLLSLPGRMGKDWGHVSGTAGPRRPEEFSTF